MRRGSWVVLMLGLAPATAGCSPDEVATSGSAEAAEHEVHEVVVRTRLVGPEAYYYEGAVVHVRLEPGSASEERVPEVWGPEEVGGQARWDEVAEGQWRLVGSTRVCNGNCGELSGPSDACALDLDVTTDTTVVVTYRWGEPCRIAVS